ncbi:MAG: activase, partial [Thermodesulfovibrionales bacterium]|nr:activase [Thermodesulfovibrionales bacterium]
MIAGIDIGSRAIKLVILDNGNLIAHKIVESSYEPHRQAEALLKEFRPHKIIATGYGRHFAKKFFAHDIITEIKAHSIGARYFYPKCMTIVDVGGQDTKVILLNVDGNVVNFQMNDKCAAG